MGRHCTPTAWAELKDTVTPCWPSCRKCSTWSAAGGKANLGQQLGTKIQVLKMFTKILAVPLLRIYLRQTEVVQG